MDYIFKGIWITFELQNYFENIILNILHVYSCFQDCNKSILKQFISWMN